MVRFSQCIECKHYLGKKENDIRYCKAFPDGIPSDVFLSKVIHDKPIEGDHGILYEEVKN